MCSPKLYPSFVQMRKHKGPQHLTVMSIPCKLVEVQLRYGKAYYGIYCTTLKLFSDILDIILV